MYLETIKNLFCDEVAETIAAIPADSVIEYDRYTYEIPRNFTRPRTGHSRVMEWRAGVLHGINGDMSVRDPEGYVCGLIPVRTLVNMLAHETFIIRSAVPDDIRPIIHSVHDLAEYLETTIDGIAENVRKYHDYETDITFADDSITLTTTAGETGKKLSKELFYPFSADVYDDAHIGLQCWADATYWDAVHAGEV